MKTLKTLAVGFLVIAALTNSQAGVISTTVHGVNSHDLDAMIASGDLISGKIGVELPGDKGWHPANGDPLDKLPAFTDDAGTRSGVTGLLNDFPGPGAPAKKVKYSFPASDISRIQILSGNDGGDGRVFSTTVISYSVNNGASFEVLGYFQSDPSGTLNNPNSNPRYRSTLVSIYDDASPLLRAGVTDLLFDLYAVDNTGGQLRDPFDGINPFTGVDDGLNATFVSPLIWELDVMPIPEPAAPALLLLGWLLFRKR